MKGPNSNQGYIKFSIILIILLAQLFYISPAEALHPKEINESTILGTITLNGNLSVSMGAPKIDPSQEVIPIKEKEVGLFLRSLKLLFGDFPSNSSYFYYLIGIWIIFLFIFSIFQSSIFKYSLWINLIISLPLTSLLFNLTSITRLIQLIDNHINSTIGKLLLIVLIVFTLGIEVYILYKKRSSTKLVYL